MSASSPPSCPRPTSRGQLRVYPAHMDEPLKIVLIATASVTGWVFADRYLKPHYPWRRR